MSDNELILNRAKAAVLSRDFTLAARLYKTLLKQKPQDVGLLSQLGSLYVKSGDDALALPVFKEIVQLKQNDFNALNNLGGIYRRLKKYSESVAVLEQALATGENDAQVSYNLGFTYKLMGDYDDAIACFEDVVATNPSDVLAFNHIGAIHALQGDHEKAIASYERGLKIDPNHPVLQLNMAKSCESLGKYDKAISAYENALRSKPGWLEAIDSYAHLLLKLNRTREAADIVLQAIRLNPKDVKMHTRLGTVYTQQSDYGSAKTEYKEALKTDTNYDPALTGLANAQEQLGENDEAVMTMQKVEEHKPDDPEMLKQFAHILMSANHLNAASQKLEKLWKKNPNDVQVLNLLGQYYICKGDNKKVSDCFKQIDAINPTYYDHFRDGAGRYRQIGELSTAEKYLLKYLDKKPDDSAALTALAADYESLKRFGDALKLYRKAMDLDVNNVLTRSGVKRMKDKMTAEDIEKEEEEEIKEEQNHLEEKDANADFEKAAVTEIKMDATDSQFETLEEQKSAAEQTEKKDTFDFDQFGIENLAKEEPLDPVFFEDSDALSGDKPVDADDTLLSEDDDTPIEADEVAPVEPMQIEPEQTPAQINSSPLSRSSEPEQEDKNSDNNPFSDENINDSAPEDDPIAQIPEPKDEERMGPDFKESEDKDEQPDVPSQNLNKVPSDDSDSGTEEKQSAAAKAIEEKLKGVNEAAEKALYAAQQAWSAAQRAADSAQEADEARSQPALKDEKTEPDKEHEADTEEKKSAPKEQPAPKEQTVPPVEQPQSIALGDEMLPLTDPDVSDGDDTDVSELAKTTALFERAVNTLPAIVNVLVNHDMIDRFKSSLEMFKKLRSLSEYLPPTRREAFMSSKTRLLLDYIIAKLSGEPGLLATSEALRKSGVLMNMAPSPMTEETGIALVTRVLNDMRGYISALPDPSLRQALDVTVADTLGKL